MELLHDISCTSCIRMICAVYKRGWKPRWAKVKETERKRQGEIVPIT